MHQSEKKKNRFINPWTGSSTRKSIVDLLKWGFQGGRNKWPKWINNRIRARPIDQVKSGKVAVTFINHATFLIQLPGINILTDPVFGNRVSPVQWAGPKRVRAPGMTMAELPDIHLVLITHNHYDHMDIPTLRELTRRFSPLIISGLGNERFLRKRGLDKVAELDWGDEILVGSEDSGPRVMFTPTQHFAARTPWDADTTLWGGFIIKMEYYKIYFTGDTGYTEIFKGIGAEQGPFDLAFIPIGAYEPRWFMNDTHVNPEESVQLHLDIRAKKSIAMHFGTFQLTDEAIDAPVRRLNAALKDNHINHDQFVILDQGETRLF